MLGFGLLEVRFGFWRRLWSLGNKISSLRFRRVQGFRISGFQG